MSDEQDGLMDTWAAARYLGVNYKRMLNMRCPQVTIPNGPDWVKLPNGRVRYRRSALDCWQEFLAARRARTFKGSWGDWKRDHGAQKGVEAA